jgi:hypothetical protein
MEEEDADDDSSLADQTLDADSQDVPMDEDVPIEVNGVHAK